MTTEPKSIDSPLEFIHKNAGENFRIHYEDILQKDATDLGDTAEKIAAMKGKYDSVIVFIGNDFDRAREVESLDRRSIRFEEYLNEAVNAICTINENVIVVMQTGGATIPTRWHNRAKAILQMWYSGEGGGKAIADILFGKTVPSGKLSETFILKERKDIDYPGNGSMVRYNEGVMVGYRHYDTADCHNVWYPFGHGLSYTSFMYSNLSADLKETHLNISLDVENTGNYDGAEIVQIYMSHKSDTMFRPKKELKAFNKVFLKKGTKKTLRFQIPLEDIAYFNPCLHKRYLYGGEYEVSAASSAWDIRLKKVITIEEIKTNRFE